MGKTKIDLFYAFLIVLIIGTHWTDFDQFNPFGHQFHFTTDWCHRHLRLRSWRKPHFGQWAQWSVHQIGLQMGLWSSSITNSQANLWIRKTNQNHLVKKIDVNLCRLVVVELMVRMISSMPWNPYLLNAAIWSPEANMPLDVNNSWPGGLNPGRLP